MTSTVSTLLDSLFYLLHYNLYGYRTFLKEERKYVYIYLLVYVFILSYLLKEYVFLQFSKYIYNEEIIYFVLNGEIHT